ncbi:aldehyde dehydrogenase family protein [Selenomonadales bacterium OttesenSCG-928-I06]|nr:aldehyde dehydrogenase family protein [Selenomonadales bacterium OttesenSCG-928-I06]
MKVYDKQFIGGEWREGRGTAIMENRNPYTGEVIYKYRAASCEDVDDAYKAAVAAQRVWAQTPMLEKQGLIFNLLNVIRSKSEDIYACLREEGGSAKGKCDMEFFVIQEIVNIAANFPLMMEGKTLPSCMPGKENFTFRMPKGVIGVIAPWNVPIVLAWRSVLPAVATGNGVVLKPASDTPGSGMLIGEIFEEAGFPKGLVNVVAGKGSEIGDHFVLHPTPALISFTGSTDIGKQVGSKAGSMIKDVSLELGGNNVMIVLKDADIEKAAEKAAFGAHFHQSQICMRLNRIIIVKERYEEFCKAYVEAVKRLPVGDPSDPNVFIGPIINQSQVKNIEGLLEGSIKAGAKVILQGKTEGNVIHPWVLRDVTNDMPSAANEVFGPISSLIKAEDEEDALAIANDTEFGLSGSVFTEDVYHGMEVARRIESGMTHVNDQSINDENHVMFGGEKMSGIGRFNFKWVLEKFTTEKWVSVTK